MSCEEGKPCPEACGKILVGYLWKIYAGIAEDVTPEEREDYLRLWCGLPPLKQYSAPPLAEPIPPAKPATIIDRLKAFAQANKYELAWRAQGGSPPTREERSARLALCMACDQREEDRCSICGCYLEARLIPPIPLGKIDMATQACPIGKWAQVGQAPGAGCCGKTAD